MDPEELFILLWGDYIDFDDDDDEDGDESA